MLTTGASLLYPPLLERVTGTPAFAITLLPFKAAWSKAFKWNNVMHQLTQKILLGFQDTTLKRWLFLIIICYICLRCLGFLGLYDWDKNMKNRQPFYCWYIFLLYNLGLTWFTYICSLSWLQDSWKADTAFSVKAHTDQRICCEGYLFSGFTSISRLIELWVSSSPHARITILCICTSLLNIWWLVMKWPLWLLSFWCHICQTSPVS